MLSKLVFLLSVATFINGACHAQNTSVSGQIRHIEQNLIATQIDKEDLGEEHLTLLVDVLTDTGSEEMSQKAAARIIDFAGNIESFTSSHSNLIRLIQSIDQVPEKLRWYTGPLLVYSTHNNPELGDALRKLIDSHENPDVRYFALRILTAAASPRSIMSQVALERSDNDPDRKVRLAALRYLEEHAAAEKPSIECFTSLLRHSDPAKRMIAARALQNSEDHAASTVPHLLGLLTAEDQYPAVRLQVWHTLQTIAKDDARISGPETKQTSDSDEKVAGLEQRLSIHFQSQSQNDPFQIHEDYLKGNDFFSTRGWRGGETQLPAFPGARGFGKWTPGGRGGEIYRVTNLNDSGPGSFRDAVSQNHRIVIFNVSGTIQLQEQLNIDKPYITIAGQTAPGSGIAVAESRTQISTNDVILRHMRFRPGDHSEQRDKALNINSAENIIIDHLSTSWAKEETMSVVHSGRVTIQNSLITHGLVDAGHYKGERGYGSLIRGTGPDNRDYAQGSNYSFLNNLWAHQRARAPRPGNYRDHKTDPVGPVFDFRNNVFYNWGGNRAGDNYDDHSISRYNYMGNYYKPGPDSEGQYAFYEESPYARAYWEGNVMDGKLPEPQSSLILGLDHIPDSYMQSQPFHAGAHGPTLDAFEAFENVLHNAGAHPRDPYDLGVIREVRDGTGSLIDSHEEAGGYPELGRALPPRDTANDGMPDWWKIKNGFHPEITLDPSGDINRSGYTNIEEYLNNTPLDLFYQ